MIIRWFREHFSNEYWVKRYFHHYLLVLYYNILLCLFQPDILLFDVAWHWHRENISSNMLFYYLKHLQIEHHWIGDLKMRQNDFQGLRNKNRWAVQEFYWVNLCSKCSIWSQHDQSKHHSAAPADAIYLPKFCKLTQKM